MLAVLPRRAPRQSLEHGAMVDVVRLELIAHPASLNPGRCMSGLEAINEVVDVGGPAVDAIPQPDQGRAGDAHVKGERWRREVRGHQLPS